MFKNPLTEFQNFDKINSSYQILQFQMDQGECTRMGSGSGGKS